jgi:hypothetical protein
LKIWNPEEMKRQFVSWILIPDFHPPAGGPNSKKFNV